VCLKVVYQLAGHHVYLVDDLLYLRVPYLQLR
jgi:hypothetical protein